MKKSHFLLIVFSLFLLLLANLSFAGTTTAAYPFHVTVSGKGTPVLFIPGFTCSADVWKETIAHYESAHECHVLTIDGFAGEPVASTEIHLTDVKDGIIRYIKDKKLQQVTLVGHSMGGFLAMWIASELHTNLQGIIIVDALPFFAGSNNPNAKTGFDSTAAVKFEQTLKNMDPDQRFAFGKQSAVMLCADTNRVPLIASWSAASDAHTTSVLFFDMMGMDLRQTISSIQVPVLCLIAFDPAFGMPAENFENTWKTQYAKCNTCTFHTATGARHFIMYDQPQWMYAEMDQFFANAEKKPAGK